MTSPKVKENMNGSEPFTTHKSLLSRHHMAKMLGITITHLRRLEASKAIVAQKKEKDGRAWFSVEYAYAVLEKRKRASRQIVIHSKQENAITGVRRTRSERF